MADVAKVQGVTVANLAKMWGTTVANIAKVMGLTVSNISGTVTAGTPAVFESAMILYCGVCMMDSTHAIVVYADAGNSSYGTACCLSLSGTTITAGTPVVFESAGVSYPRVCALDASNAIVAYADGGNSNYGTACHLGLSGTTITAGTPAVFESASTYNTGNERVPVCKMDSTHAIVAYTDIGDSQKGVACCLTLSGTTISAGTPVIFESGSCNHISIATLTSSVALVSYRDVSNSNQGTACCLSLSGTTITAGTPVVFESGNTQHVSVCALSSTLAVTTYQDSGNTNQGTACGLSISGTTITAGTPVVFETGATIYTAATAMDETHAIVAYADNGNSNYGTACCLTLAGTVVTAGTPTIYESAGALYTFICTATSTTAIVVYSDVGNSNYGTACCLTLS